MLTGLLCYWCVATVVHHSFTHVDNCGSGTQDQMEEVARTRTTGSGQLFLTECLQPGQKPQLTWGDKQGGFFFKQP